MPEYTVEKADDNKIFIKWNDTDDFTEVDRYGNVILYIKQPEGTRVILARPGDEHHTISTRIANLAK